MDKYKLTFNGVSGESRTYVLVLSPSQSQLFMDRFVEGNTKLTISLPESNTFLAFNFDNAESVMFEKCN